MNETPPAPPASESPIFVRTHELLAWLLAATRKFPREQRFVLAQRVAQQAFGVQDALIAAALDRNRQAAHLLAADIALNGLRKSLQLCHELHLLSDGQYGHVSRMVYEIGRLLGGWRKKSGPA